MASVGSGRRRRRHALVVGINRYPKLAEAMQLRGCVNDARAMAAVLKTRFGFGNDEVALLADEAATREAILSGFDDMVARASTDDLVVLHFSGHGSRIRDREGDEPDGWDETIVPSDSGRPPHPNRDITDDEIYLRLVRLTRVTPYVTLIFDSCFSGTIARDPFATPARWLPADPRAAGELPPSPVVREDLPGVRAAKGPSGWLPLSQRYVLLAACRHDEQAHEIVVDGGDPAAPTRHGVFSYQLCRRLVEATRGASYRDVFEATTALVTGIVPTQHPQLEGARDREVLGVRSLVPLRFLPVVERSEREVMLAGGAAHGLALGSEWAVYPASTRKVTRSTRRLGLIRIRHVGAVTASAEVVDEGSDGDITAGSRAVEHRHGYAATRLAVELHETPAPAANPEALRRRITASPFLRLAGAGERGRARVYALAPRRSVAPGAPAPQLGPIDEALWVAVGDDGDLLTPAVPVSNPRCAAGLADHLEVWARRRFVLELENRDPGSSLRGRVRALLLRQRTGGSWEPARSAGTRSEVVFEEGEQIAVAVTHSHDAPIYVQILDLGLTGNIQLIYPVAGANEPLARGRTLRVGVREGQELHLVVPHGFPFVPQPPSAILGGNEYFKVLFTTQPMDAASLLQTGFRSGPRKLEDLPSPATAGHGARDTGATAIEDWYTLTLPFTLERRPGAR